MIHGKDIEKAEQVLRRTYAIGRGGDPRIIADRARVDREAFDNLMKHHRAGLFSNQGGYMPDIDPRHEPAIMTMMMHFFAVGAIAQRVSKGDEPGA